MITAIPDYTSKQEYTRVDDEIFYKLNVKIKTGVIPIVISQFMLAEYPRTVSLNGYLRCDKLKNPTGAKMFTYYKVLEMNAVGGDLTPPIVEVLGKIPRICEITIDSNKEHQLYPVLLKTRGENNHFSILHLMFRGVLARRLYAIKGTAEIPFHGTGELRIKKGSVGIDINNIIKLKGG